MIRDLQLITDMNRYWFKICKLKGGFHIIKGGIFDRRPWLLYKDNEQIIHNDLDGLLTGMLCRHFLGWKTVGVYDLENIWREEKYQKKLSVPIYVDLDITYPNIKSIGHHMLIETNKNAINVNNVFGINSSNFTKKYPLGTVLFLMWLFNIPLPKNREAKLLLLIADSAWLSYSRYKENVTNWIKKMGFDELLDILNDINTEKEIEEKILPLLYGRNKQCSFTAKEGKFIFKRTKTSIIPLIKELENILEWKGLSSDLEGSTYVKGFSFQRLSLGKTRGLIPVNDYKNYKNSAKIFSHSQKFYHEVNISYF